MIFSVLKLKFKIEKEMHGFSTSKANAWSVLENTDPKLQLRVGTASADLAVAKLGQPDEQRDN